MADEIKDEWGRFFAHWFASALGYYLRTLLPELVRLQDPTQAIDFRRWWARLLFAALVSLVGGGINSNLPAKPRELLKSVGLGFALDAVALLAKVAPGP
jgi:hypothetical protein